MYKDNKRYIAEDDTRDDYIKLDLRIDSPEGVWKEAIRLMDNRLTGRYFDPINALLHENPGKNGFAAMAICCLLIETLLQFYKGFTQIKVGNCKTEYKNFIMDLFDMDKQSAEHFYTDIRCGILHSGQTYNGSCLTVDTGYLYRKLSNETLIVDVCQVYDVLKRYYKGYCSRLMNHKNFSLRRDFIAKMDDITKRFDGCSEMDDLLYNIRAHENDFMYTQKGKVFTYHIVRDGTALRTNKGVYVSINDILDALNYWPDENSIKSFINGNVILSILTHFRDIADAFAQKRGEQWNIE